MPKLIRLQGHAMVEAQDAFVALADDEAAPDRGSSGVIVSLARFEADSAALLGGGRALGVRLTADQPVEALAEALPRLALVALEFPKFRDGRPYTAATLLRERFGFAGEVRAVGEVLRELAQFMARCGFDAFEPADGSTPEQWARAAFRYHHVYQAAADQRPPAFIERAEHSAEALVEEG